MSTSRIRWFAAAITTTALAMSGPVVAQAAGPTPSPTPPASSSTAPSASAPPASSSATPPTVSSTASSASAPSTSRTPAQPSTPAFKSTLVYATGTVTVRSTASTSSKSLGTLSRGNDVGTRNSGNGTATLNGWTAVTYQGKAGWVPVGSVSTTKPAPAPKPKPSTPAFRSTLVYATTTVTVRAGASTSSKSLGTLSRGNYVGTRNSGNGTATRNGWTAVAYKGKAAWISARYLSAKRPAPAPRPAPFRAYIVYARSTVPVRVSPSLAARSIANLHRGNHLSAIGITQRGFTPVSYRGHRAWVQTSYLSRSKPVANPQRLDRRCLSGLTLCISKTERKLRLVRNGKVLITLDARFGRASSPTREGAFAIFQKSRNWVSTLYGSKMPFSMFFSGGEAVHYSSDFAARGYAGASHGCVNIRSWSGIEYVFNHAPLGTRVIVYR